MKRLDTVCSLITPAKVVADVGCDHGLVAGFCARSGMFERVIASDISRECLNKAVCALEGCDNVQFICCNGIDYDCDEAVIAGMGGLNISEIIEHAKSLPYKLILCPHRDEYAVRKTLVKYEYYIDADVMIEERGRFYSVISAERSGKKQNLSELMLRFGVNYEKQNEVLQKYLIKQYATYSVAPESNAERLKYIYAALRAQNAADKIQINGD